MIRSAKKEDIMEIINLLHQVHDIHAEKRPDIFKKGTTKYNKKDIKKLMKCENSPIFVYVLNEKVVGYIFCFIKKIRNDQNLCDNSYLFVDDLCVLKEYRGRKIGTELYNYAKDFAREKNIKNIRLNVWNLNKKAIDFYQKNGMKILEYVMEDKL